MSALRPSRRLVLSLAAAAPVRLARAEATTSFPSRFVWGAATSAYQIEGAPEADGKGPSVWDVFVRKRGAVADGHTGADACHSYERFREDVALLSSMGLRAYRFSVSWPRVLPTGTGAVNAAGLDHYERMVDALLAANIEPWLTLFHWDLPLALHYQGGWLARDSAGWFGAYAEAVARRLGDRVKRWITLNEPQVVIGNGYKNGTHAPGLRLAMPDLLVVNHNLLRAHGAALAVLRASGKPGTKVGFAAAMWMKLPADDRPETVAAVRSSLFHVGENEVEAPAMQLDPLFQGRYPESAGLAFGAALPADTDAEWKAISAPVDFCGLNLYFGARFRAGKGGQLEFVPFAPGFPSSAFGWPILPEVLYWGPKLVHERYRAPIVITENGLSCHDWVSEDGAVHDPQRVDFLRRSLAQLRRAIADGTRVDGYFHWSLLDNFEWAEGYKQRFGLVHVDFATGKRTRKDSATAYGAIARRNAL